MTGRAVLEEIQRLRSSKDQFIRWWRREEDYLDFDLIDTFIANTSPDEEIGGFDLLGMDEMWDQLQKVAPGRVDKTQKAGNPLISWRKKSGEELLCPYTPRTCIEIFDAETRGNYVD